MPATTALWAKCDQTNDAMDTIRFRMPSGVRKPPMPGVPPPQRAVIRTTASSAIPSTKRQAGIDASGAKAADAQPNAPTIDPLGTGREAGIDGNGRAIGLISS